MENRHHREASQLTKKQVLERDGLLATSAPLPHDLNERHAHKRTQMTERHKQEREELRRKHMAQRNA